MDVPDRIARARGGDERAFAELVQPQLPSLRRLACQMLAHPEDADDLVQDTLLTAYQKLASFRGDSETSFRTWILTIASRKCIDRLRVKQRWPADAQVIAEAKAVASPATMAQIHEAVGGDEFSYDFRQHMAYCFTCLCRTLAPVEAAALLLREVFEFKNREAAKALGLSESVFRRHLASGRATMQSMFRELCALVGKQGVCYQCDTMRNEVPEARRGPPVVQLRLDDDAAAFDERVQRIRAVEFGGGAGWSIHGFLLRYMSEMFG